MLSNLEVSDPRFTRDGLRWTTITSTNLGGRGDMVMYVPEEAAGQADVPVAILLHGVFGSHWGWALRGGAHRTAARLIREGAVPPMILAMPSDGLWGEGSGYVKHADRDFEAWIVEDVPALVKMVEPSVTERSRWFIAGLSMGGFGALRLGARYPERFEAASGLSSATHLQQLARFVPEGWASHGVASADFSVFETIRRYRARMPRIRFDCGTEDELLGANRELHDQLTAAGIEHTYQEFRGGHTWEYWEAHLEDTLRFFAGSGPGGHSR